MKFKFFEIRRCGIRKSVYLFNKRILSYKNTKMGVEEYVRSLGVKLGKNPIIATLPNAKFPYSWPIFASEPFLVEIGDNARISYNVSFITHDASLDVVKKYIDEKERDGLFSIGKIKIGNNCMIGCNVTILPNVTIGDNSIIGAGSVVSKNIPPGEIWGGCPIKFIKKTSELAQKYLELNRTDEMDKLKEEFKQGYEKYIKAQ